VIAGSHVSEPAKVVLTLPGSAVGSGFVTVYPNPVANAAVLESRSIIDYYEIYDSYGRLMAKAEVNSRQASFNLSDWSKGIYYLKAVSANQQFVRKISKL